MDLDHFTAQMAHNAETIESLTAWIGEEQARWKPDPDSWSILEVVNHLYDEEREDFGARLDHILTHSDLLWPPIDPQGWVTARRYNERVLSESVSRFLKERRRSLSWLRGLESPDWQAGVDAPFGRLTAGDVFAAWVVHDLLHVRQLVRLHWAYTVRSAAPYKVDYAGSW